jgi:hypothetical protein
MSFGIKKMFETSVFDRRRAAFVPVGRLCAEGEVRQLESRLGASRVKATAIEVVEDPRASRLAELDRMAEQVEIVRLSATARLELRKAIREQRARLMGAA